MRQDDYFTRACSLHSALLIAGRAAADASLRNIVSDAASAVRTTSPSRQPRLPRSLQDRTQIPRDHDLDS